MTEGETPREKLPQDFAAVSVDQHGSQGVEELVVEIIDWQGNVAQMNRTQFSRRVWLKSGVADILTFGRGVCAATLIARPSSGNGQKLNPTRGFGDVETPCFYRHDIGTAPGRMHEPTAGTDGNIWTSPLDGNLWQYDTQTGTAHVHNLRQLTGREWKGLHLWPVARGPLVCLCTPSLPELHVWNRQHSRITSYRFPHERPSVYGGFVEPSWRHVYFYDTRHASVLKWDLESQTGENFPCPFRLSGTLYMTFTEPARKEIWGSTYTGNDIVGFDISMNEWTAHYKCPLEGSTPTPGGKVFGDTLFVSDHLGGRIIPLNAETGVWGEPIPVPGYREWFGYISGGWHFRGKLYMCHSTWTGGTSSIDGEPHHFLGSWTVFDPETRRFSRLDIPTRVGEERKHLMSDYCAVTGDHLYLLAVNMKPPRNVIVLQSKMPGRPDQGI